MPLFHHDEDTSSSAQSSPRSSRHPSSILGGAPSEQQSQALSSLSVQTGSRSKPDPRDPADTLWLVARGCFGACLCACLLFSLLLAALPLPFLTAWLASPRSFHRSFPIVFDYREAEPSATAFLVPSSRLPKSLKSKSSNTSSSRKLPSPFVEGQHFRATLLLHLPESEHNMELGLFQVSAAALSHDGHAVAHASVPCIVKFRSLPLRLLRAAVFAVPLFLGLMKEAQTVKLVVLEGVAGPDPVSAIKLSLHPSSANPASLSLPQISSAQLAVRTSLWGSSPWLALGPLSWFVWVLGLLCCYEALGALICCNFFLLPGFGAFRHGVAALLDSISGVDDDPSQELGDDFDDGIPVGVPLSSAAAAARGSLLAQRYSQQAGMPAAAPLGLDASQAGSQLCAVRTGAVNGADVNGGSGRVPDVEEEERSLAEDEEAERVLHAVQHALGAPSGRDSPEAAEAHEEGAGSVSSEASSTLVSPPMAENGAPLPEGLRQRRGGRDLREEEEEGEEPEEEEEVTSGGSGRGTNWFFAAPGGAECDERRKKT